MKYLNIYLIFSIASMSSIAQAYVCLPYSNSHDDFKDGEGQFCCEKSATIAHCGEPTGTCNLQNIHNGDIRVCKIEKMTNHLKMKEQEQVQALKVVGDFPVKVKALEPPKFNCQKDTHHSESATLSHSPSQPSPELESPGQSPTRPLSLLEKRQAAAAAAGKKGFTISTMPILKDPPSEKRHIPSVPQDPLIAEVENAEVALYASYKRLDSAGNGTDKTVYKCIHIATDELRACSCSDRDRDNEQPVINALKASIENKKDGEVPPLVLPLETFRDARKVCRVTPYMKDGSAMESEKETITVKKEIGGEVKKGTLDLRIMKKNSNLNPEQIYENTAKLCKALLEIFHANGIVHGDIKPDNLLQNGSHLFFNDYGKGCTKKQLADPKLFEFLMPLNTSAAYKLPTLQREKIEETELATKGESMSKRFYSKDYKKGEQVDPQLVEARFEIGKQQDRWQLGLTILNLLSNDLESWQKTDDEPEPSYDEIEKRIASVQNKKLKEFLSDSMLGSPASKWESSCRALSSPKNH